MGNNLISVAKDGFYWNGSLNDFKIEKEQLG